MKHLLNNNRITTVLVLFLLIPFLGIAQPCPSPTGGSKKKSPGTYSGDNASMEILASNDPNEIIGPDGEPTKKWVSRKDRLPYTILYENSKEASAPAKFVRITAPLQPKQDPSTFQLGDFGFNSLTFSVPPNTSSLYRRLDVRDSFGLFVDVIAGYDQMNNVAFWEFQSIDPITLLPPKDPLKGFLLLQDSLNERYGHGFVNFSAKPKQSAVTLDTIAARAEIIFDDNEMIPTNIHTNTIDAFAPTSHLTRLSLSSTSPIQLSWTGADDAGGSGIRSYTLYVSTDGTNYSIVSTGMTRKDTTFVGTLGATYCFFVLATDTVGNMETLNQSEITCTSIGGVVPVTMLYFRGKTIEKDNILEWETQNEINARSFSLMRSLTGNDFEEINSTAARGNSGGTYSYRDRNIDRLHSNVFFYKLKQIDNDGRSSLSNVVRLTYNKGSRPSIVYPNPTKGIITLSIGDPKLIGTNLELLDVSGRRLQSIQLTGLTQNFDLSNYVNGTYIFKLANKESLKVIKQ